MPLSHPDLPPPHPSSGPCYQTWRFSHPHLTWPLPNRCHTPSPEHLLLLASQTRLTSLSVLCWVLSSRPTDPQMSGCSRASFLSAFSPGEVICFPESKATLPQCHTSLQLGPGVCIRPPHVPTPLYALTRLLEISVPRTDLSISPSSPPPPRCPGFSKEHQPPFSLIPSRRGLWRLLTLDLPRCKSEAP